jgi:serine/threonine protein kinase
MCDHCVLQERQLPSTVLTYMSPETLAHGVRNKQADVWAFGVLLHFMTTQGAPAYPGLTAKEVSST